jgi:hypothetical protein
MHTEKTSPEPDPLGARYREYQPAATSLAGGFVLGLLLIAGGVAVVAFALHGAYRANWDLPLRGKTGWSWFAVGICHVFGSILVYLGLAFANGAQKLVASSVDLRTEGFRVRSRGHTEDIRWDDVQLIRHVTQFLRLRRAETVLTQVQIVARSGKEYAFDPGTLQGFDEFAKILFDVARERSIRWENVEMRN